MIQIQLKFHLIEKDGVPARKPDREQNFIDCIVIQKSGYITIATWSRAHQYFYSPLYKKVLNDVIGWHKCKAHPLLLDQIKEYKEEHEVQHNQEGCVPLLL